MKPGKHQRGKQRCEDLCWKVHDRARRSSVLRSYTIHELRNENICIGYLTTIVFCARPRPKKIKKNMQQRTLSSFITIPLDCLRREREKMRGMTLGIWPTRGIKFLSLIKRKSYPQKKPLILLKPTEMLIHNLVLNERHAISSLSEVCHRLNSLY